ncbi:flavin reductase family protein [Tsukamurella tyrosinosolvens]|uniref:3-hydroxy-9,10-secoandrosta-1,3,5(10)-triene-9,17-dione monooxygenase reductase component n=1 Tax=Tsukamurella tyrosinosolvens TaxID=57704 RepID=A0A1H4MCY2_TSUTY|nr:3-hydroxy-9,10-secoandrosta-1,3,5(10)-triene-9,17-dione monooxygenase reductase subunit [Tsukamurella tyrosinosolvens]AUN39108.1 monooxygenase [Tsukamurella tyrosinosolvens]KXO96820.1 monooxygenase [Tsukamurella tyrosinosolvens]KXP02366.1 monooxygenase [Tsukamurella tyrosinosolvens]KZL96504.1 monooxygenase [Tsukamurella tyrosinosolvens]MCA4996392.1 flavin reductase family protein [Tsukamurella tyrosinosolvens]
MTEAGFDQRTFRHVMGQFCTGVTIIATSDAAEKPVGFACQSFAALSLDPPLVLFCPMKTSRTWKHIEASGKFAVSVLGQEQESVSAAFGRSVDDKFDGLRWTPSPLGNPTIDGSLTWMDCTLENVLDGGDHHIAIGRVHHLGDVDDAKPLLFYRGAYLSTNHPQQHPASSLESFLTWDSGAWL